MDENKYRTADKIDINFAWAIYTWSISEGYTPTGEDYKRVENALEQNFTKLIEQNVPGVKKVSRSYHYTDDGFESIYFDSVMTLEGAQLAAEWANETVEDDEGNVEIIRTSSSSGLLRLPVAVEKAFGEADFEVILELQFEKPFSL